MKRGSTGHLRLVAPPGTTPPERLDALARAVMAARKGTTIGRSPVIPSALLAYEDDVSGGLLRSALARAGWKVEAATDVETAANQLATHRWDVVIAELALPGGGFRAVFRRASIMGAPVVALLGDHEKGAEAAQLVQAGAIDCVWKPIADPAYVVELATLVAGSARRRDRLREVMETAAALSRSADELVQSDPTYPGATEDIAVAQKLGRVLAEVPPPPQPALIIGEDAGDADEAPEWLMGWLDAAAEILASSVEQSEPADDEATDAAAQLHDVDTRPSVPTGPRVHVLPIEDLEQLVAPPQLEADGHWIATCPPSEQRSAARALHLGARAVILATELDGDWARAAGGRIFVELARERRAELLVAGLLRWAQGRGTPDPEEEAAAEAAAQRAQRPRSAGVLASGALGERLRGEASADGLVLETHSKDQSIYRIRPTLVAFPEDAEDVAELMCFARDQGLSVTARGAGTGVTGGTLGFGVIADLSRHMASRLEWADDGASHQVWVDPGVTWQRLNRFLARRGRYLPPDPGSGALCTLGGMVANNSAGSHSLLYGATRDYVEALDVVLADGQTMRARHVAVADGELQELPEPEADIYGALHALLSPHKEAIEAGWPRTQKNSSGYALREALTDNGIDLAQLMTGSEGTLGVVTRILLSTAPLPGARVSAAVTFPGLEPALAAIPLARASGASAVELLDDLLLMALRTSGKAPPPTRGGLLDRGVKAWWLLDFDGGSREVAIAAAERFREQLADTWGRAAHYIPAYAPESRAQLWDLRRAASSALKARAKGAGSVRCIEDMCVPIDRLPEFGQAVRKILDRHGVRGAIFGHAGSGHLHVNPLVEHRGEAAREIVESLMGQAYAAVLHYEGTLSGEHGDGRLRTAFLPALYKSLYPLFGEVKALLDPEGRLNPGVKVGATPGGHLNHMHFA